MKVRTALATATILAATLVTLTAAVPLPIEDFYVFTEAGSKLNHFIPSGWMGDYGDLKMNQRSPNGAKKSSTAIEVKYSAERKQDQGWVGVYWQTPANNWGDKKGGFDLTKYKTLKFYARGAKGKETIDKFFVGGIAGTTQDGDSDSANTENIELTTQWQEYKIDLHGLDLSHIIGGFGFAMNADMNPNGATFYIDEVRFE